MTSGWEASVEKKPPFSWSQKRASCVSVGILSVHIQVEDHVSA